MRKIFSCALMLAVLFYSCTKSGGSDTENNPPDPPPGGGNCDTVNMEYAADVVPILQANCYSCHGANTNSGSFGRVLEGYSNLKTYAENGTLVGVISHAQGFIPMPQNGPKLSQCNIDKIKSWIDNGVKNN